MAFLAAPTPGTHGRTRSADRGCPRPNSRLTPPTCSFSARVTSGVIKVPPRVRSLPFSTLVSAGTVSRATPEPSSGEGAMMSTGGNVTDSGSAVSEGACCARAATHASVRTAATPASVPAVRRTSGHEHLAIYISIPPRSCWPELSPNRSRPANGTHSRIRREKFPIFARCSVSDNIRAWRNIPPCRSAFD